MDCVPASKMMKTNGTVFQTSTMIIAVIAAGAVANQEKGIERIFSRNRIALITPNWSLKIQAHNTAMIAVGRVQGIRSIVRTVSCLLLNALADKARTKPSANSSATETSVKTTVT